MEDIFRIPPEQIPGTLVKNLDVLLPWLPTDPYHLDFAVDRYRESRTVATVAWDEPFDRVIPRWIRTMTVPTMVMWGTDDALIPVGQAKAWAELVPDCELRSTPIRSTLRPVSMYVLSVAAGGVPAFWPFMILLALVLIGYNVLLSNLNSAAMVPVGHVAGTAAAVYATVTTAGAAIIGQRFDKAFDGTVSPFSLAFAIAGLLSLVMVLALRQWQHREIR